MSRVQNQEFDGGEPPQVRLRSIPGADQNALGVFATRRIRAGSVALLFPGSLASEPDRYSIQVGERTHLHGAGTSADELRHACEPNARIVVEGAPPARVVALRDIEPGEEITIDYCATEDVVSEPFACSCGASGCYGQVRGYRYLDRQQRERLGHRASGWLVSRQMRG